MANTVDELKALANTKLGFARPNRFLVTMPTSFGGSGGLLNGIVGLLTGGGGGASETGGTQPGPSFRSANGGDGVPTGINPSTCVGTPGPAPGRWFAGGGESCGNPSCYGGFGGGGGSSPMSGCSPSVAGKANTGGGGGGRSATGGSGIVIIRYKSA